MDIRTMRLRKLFESSGLTQSDICKQTNINKGALSSYLSGRYFPKQKSLEKLANIFGVPIEYLMGLSDDAGTPSSDSSLTDGEQQIVSSFRQLNEEGRERLLNYADDLVASGRYIKNNEDALVEGA